MHRLPALTPPVLQPADVKSGCPNNRLAAMPEVRGPLYSSSRWLLSSATYRFPALSIATPEGKHRLLALSPPLLQPPEVKLGCPKTRLAAMPVVRGQSYSNSREL